MKLRELIDDLERLLASDPDVRFQSVKYIGNGTQSTEAGFVDAKLAGGIVTIRVTVPPDRVNDVRGCGHDT